MEILCKLCVVHGLLLSLIGFASGQGGGVAIGLGAGDFMLGSPFGGDLQSPFMTMVPTDSTPPPTGPPTTPGTVGSGNMGSTLQTATVSTIGGGFNPSDLFSMFGGTGEGVVVNSAAGQHTYDIQTEPPPNPTPPTDFTTKKATIEVNNLDQKGFTLQNEAYTPIGSVGNLVKVPTDPQSQSNTASLQILPKPKSDFADIIVKPVSPINSPLNTDVKKVSASTQNNNSPSLTTDNFNPGTGMADEIAALQSSMLGSPVDMSNFLPPPSSNFDMSAGPVGSIGDLPVPAEFSTNPDSGVPVNSPAFTHMKPATPSGLKAAFNPDMNKNPPVNIDSFNPDSGVPVNSPASTNMNPATPSGLKAAFNPDMNNNPPVNINSFKPDSGIPINSPASTNMNPAKTMGLKAAFNPDMNKNPAVNINSFNPDSGVPVNSPASTNMDPATTSGFKPAYNPDMNNNPAIKINSFNPDSGVPVNSPASTNMDPATSSGFKPAYNPDMNNNPAVKINSFNSAPPGTDTNTNTRQVGPGGNDFLPNINSNVDSQVSPQTEIGGNQPAISSLRDMFSSSEPPTQGPGVAGEQPNHGIQDTQTTEPQLKDMTAEGIFPFEAGSKGQAAIGDSPATIQDMNKAIADHNQSDTLHLAKPIDGMGNVPPLTGTNGGRITNLVGAKPPQTLDGSANMPSLQPPNTGISEPTQAGNEPAAFVIGAGMPNAKVIQPNLVPDTRRPNTNIQGNSGMIPTRDSRAPFTESNPGIMEPSEPIAKDVANPIPSVYIPLGNNQPISEATTGNYPVETPQGQSQGNRGLPRAFGSVDQPIVDNTVGNMNSLPDSRNIPTQNTAVNDIPNLIETKTTGFEPAKPIFGAAANDVLSTNNVALNDRINNMDMTGGTDVGLVSQQHRQTLATSPSAFDAPPKARLSIDPGSGNAFVDSRKPINQVNGIVEPVYTGPNIGLTQEPFKRANERGPVTKTMPDIGRTDKSATNSASNQQIIAVKPDWLTNVFGKIGNALQPNMAETQNPPQNPIDNVGIDSNILRRNRNDFNSQPQPTVNQIRNLKDSLSNNVMPNTASDRLQIVPLQNQGPPKPTNEVFTLGAHRVLDSVPNIQPPRQDIMADYQTQNVIGTSETKPLVTDAASQLNNIQISGISPNSVEMQLKNLMMLQDAQMAMSNKPNTQPDSASVFTAFVAPGISMGRSVAVQESFGRQPNIVTIQAESNLPVTDNRPSKQIAGNLNEITSKVPMEQIIQPNTDLGAGLGQNPRMSTVQSFSNDPIAPIFTSQTNPVADLQINAIDKFANGLRLGQPVTNKNIQPLGTGPSGRGIMLPMSQDTTQFTKSREAMFGSGVNGGIQTVNTGAVNTNSAGQGNNPTLMCSHIADPHSELHFLVRSRGGYQRQRCALGSAFDPATCECSRRLEEPADCLEVHMDFNNGIVEDSSFNKLPIGNQLVEVTNKSTPLSGIALFNGDSNLTIWRYQNYDFRDHVMLKVQFRPGQSRERFQPLISNCDGDIEGPSIGIIYDNTLKEVLLVLKTSTEPKKEISFPINADQWNDVTYIYDGEQFIGIVNGVRRYVSRTDPHLLGIIGGDIKSVPASGLIEIRDAGIILGSCPRYGHFNGAMVDIQIYTCIPKNFRLE